MEKAGMSGILIDEKEIKSNLKGQFSKYDWPTREGILERYSKSMSHKNENILKLFENTDGRIVIDGSELELYVSKMSQEKGRKELYDLIDLIMNHYGSTTNKFKRVYIFKNNFKNIYKEFVESIDLETGKIDFKEKGFLAKFNGMKATKVLNSLFESYVLNEYLGNKDLDYEVIEGALKRTSTYFVGGAFSDTINRYRSSEYSDKELVISIRPEDFFSMSIGTSWGSCMSPDGEYNGGILPYTEGEDSFISFLVKKEDEETETHWKRKIWRQISYITEDNFICTQRDYPISRENLTYIVLNKVNDMLEHLFGKEISRNTNLITKSNRRIDFRNSGFSSTGYPDIFMTSGSDELFKDISEEELRTLDKVKIKAQGEGICLSCGNEGSIENIIECDDCCPEKIYCDCCENYYEEDFMRFALSGDDGQDVDHLCENCIDNYTYYFEGDNYFENSCSIVTSGEYAGDHVPNKYIAILPNGETCLENEYNDLKEKIDNEENQVVLDLD